MNQKDKDKLLKSLNRAIKQEQNRSVYSAEDLNQQTGYVDGLKAAKRIINRYHTKKAGRHDAKNHS